MTWDPSVYERFARERSLPFFDLVGLVRPGLEMRVLDLGCGTGALTRVLHERTGARQTLGIDSSAEMLERAEAHRILGLSFQQADIATFSPERPVDLVLSNAALHWLDDHPALFPRLFAMVAPRGQLAVQIPANDDGVAHRVAAEVAAEAPFSEALGGFVRRSSVLSPAGYAELLHAVGFRHQHVRLQVYPHVLDDPDQVVEWVRGTLLLAYSERLDAPTYEAFLARYRARLAEVLGPARPVFFPSPRILLWAQR